MAKILIIGSSPGHLTTRRVEARGYRTWQLTEPLLSDGHQVYLAADNKNEETKIEKDNLHYESFNLHKNIGRIRKIWNEFKPNAIVGAGFWGSEIVAYAKLKSPTWMDIYGDPLAENQVRMASWSTHKGLDTSIGKEKLILKRGDVFSACSNPQKFALIGKLSHAGRLDEHSVGYDFVHTILPGGKAQDIFATKKILRNRLVSEEDFVVLWCGGYNVWTDIETLFNGVQGAMEKNNRIKYVSIGGAAVHVKPYETFVKLVNNSKLKDNYKLLGWLPYSDVRHYYLESDVGINIDAYNYEALLGTRTRIPEMMSHGLPVITSSACELSHLLESWGAALTFSIGNHKQLSDKILELVENKEKRNELGKKSLDLINGPLSFQETTQSLRKWVKNPQYAPDKFKRKFTHILDNKFRWLAKRILIAFK